MGPCGVRVPTLKLRRFCSSREPSSISQQLCTHLTSTTVLGIQGCYGFRQEGAETPDLGVIDGRPTVIAFDADVATNHQVYDAAALIRDTLEARGVAVSFSSLVLVLTVLTTAC